MITREDLDAMGYSDYMRQKARLYCMTPLSMAKEFADTMGQKKNVKLSRTLVHEEFHEWVECFIDEVKPESELKELADLIYVAYGYANAKGWDLDEAVRRVHQNNMERCVWPDGSVKFREDGKVLKNPDAKKIDLSDLVK
jgi:hypothetical protein